MNEALLAILAQENALGAPETDRNHRESTLVLFITSGLELEEAQ
jgi:hypothetical protein